jgi:hypothetical protein
MRHAAQTGAWLDVDETVPAEMLYDLLANGARSERPLRAVKLRGARITGELNLEGATLTCPLLLETCMAEDTITLTDARVASVNITDCQLGTVLATRLDVRGNFDLSGSTVDGAIRLLGSRIGGQLILDGTTILGAAGFALVADGLRVDLGMLCREQFSAEAEIHMVGAAVGGTLEFDGATLRNPKGRALTAEHLHVGESLFCRNGFHAEGEVRLVAAHIADELNFSQSTLSNPLGDALQAERLRVDGNMYCREGFCAEGTIKLLGARIAGRLDFSGASLLEAHADSASGPTSDRPHSLNLETAQVGTLMLAFKTRPAGVINLGFSSLGILLDRPYGDALDEWPQCELDGCTYERLLTGKRISVEQRLRWLRAASDYEPQPYDQLAAMYRNTGHDAEARTVSIEKQRQRRRTLRGPARVWSYVLDGTVAYGYRLWQAGVWLCGLLVVGSLAFGVLLDAGSTPGADSDITPAKPLEQVPPFQPVLYTADLLIPVVTVGQRAGWNAHSPAAQWTAFALTLLGWLLTAAFAAGLATRRQ